MARAYGPDELGKIKISKEEKFDYWFSIINKELLEQNEHRWFVWYSVFTEIELSNEFCSELAIRYVEAGWYVVAYASVKLEEGTVTHFVFLTKDTESTFDRIHCHNLDTYWQVSEDGVVKSPIKITRK